MIDSAIIRYFKLRRCINTFFFFFMTVLLIVFVISSMIGSWVGNDVTTESMELYEYIKLVDVEKYSLYVYDAQFTVMNTTAFDSLGFLCRPQAETNETYSIKYSLLKNGWLSCLSSDISCFFSNLNLLEGLKQPSTKELFYVQFDDGIVVIRTVLICRSAVI